MEAEKRKRNRLHNSNRYKKEAPTNATPPTQKVT